MSGQKSDLRFQSRATEVQFFGTQNGPFLAKVAIIKCSKMGLWMPENENGDHFFHANIPQNGGIDICFLSF